VDELTTKDAKGLIRVQPVLEDPEVAGRVSQARVQLTDGTLVTKKEAKELYRAAIRSLKNHFDLIAVERAMSKLRLDLEWELSMLKEIAEDKRNPSMRMQALGLIRMIKAAAIQDVGPMGQTHKKLKLLAEKQAEEALDALAAVQDEAHRMAGLGNDGNYGNDVHIEVLDDQTQERKGGQDEQDHENCKPAREAEAG